MAMLGFRACWRPGWLALPIRDHSGRLDRSRHLSCLLEKTNPRPEVGEPFRRDSRLLVLTVDTMNRSNPDLLPGTLDLLILRTLQKDPQHGWAISDRIQQISNDVLQINQGSLYPALHRLEHQGWIAAEWKVSELGRRAKYYTLTASGRRQLAVEAQAWERMSHAIGRVMKLA